MKKNQNSPNATPSDWPKELPSQLFEEELATRQSVSVGFAKTRVLARLQDPSAKESILLWFAEFFIPKRMAYVGLASLAALFLLFPFFQHETTQQRVQAEMYLESLFEYDDLQGMDLFQDDFAFAQELL